MKKKGRNKTSAERRARINANKAKRPAEFIQAKNILKLDPTDEWAQQVLYHHDPNLKPGRIVVYGDHRGGTYSDTREGRLAAMKAASREDVKESARKNLMKM